jgi:cell division septum initiation protein DivIVA
MNDHFLDAIKKVRQRVDPLLARVAEARKIENRIKSLQSDKNAKQYELNGIQSTADEILGLEERTRRAAELQQEIDGLRDTMNGLPPHPVNEIRRFLLAVRDALSLVPADQQRLKDIRSELERVPLVLHADNIVPGFLAMGDAYGQLFTVKLRLDEFIPERTYEDRLKERRRIVAALQAKLGCQGREALAENLLVDVSAIRAATRGDTDHSGPAAEGKILNACAQQGLDTSGW